MSGILQVFSREYWTVIVSHKTENEIEAEKWLWTIRTGNDSFASLKCIRFSRWHICIATFFVQLCCGSLYTWSILNSQIDKHLQTEGKAVITFYITCGIGGVSAALFGPFQERHGPRLSLLLGTTLFLVGHIVSYLSLWQNSIIGIYIGYGLLTGIGIGINYIAPVSALQKWFPDYRGTAVGFAVSGFGAGSTLWAKVYVPVYQSIGICNLLLFIGFTISAIMYLCALVMRTPPPDFMVNGKDIHCVGKDKVPNQSSRALVDDDFMVVNFAAINDYRQNELDDTELHYHLKVKSLKLSQCLCSLDFAFLYIAYTGTVAFGLVALSRLASMAVDVFQMSSSDATNLVSMDGIFNFLGRLLFPIFSDVIVRVFYLNPAFGRKIIFYITLFAQFVIMWILPSTFEKKDYGTFQGIVWAITFLYGGSFGVIPSLLTDMYGVYNTGTMHGVILTCWATCAVVGGLTFNSYYNYLIDEGAAISTAYSLNFHWIHVLVGVGCLAILLVRTNPVDRFYNGYRIRVCGLTIIDISNDKGVRTDQQDINSLCYERNSSQNKSHFFA